MWGSGLCGGPAGDPQAPPPSLMPAAGSLQSTHICYHVDTWYLASQKRGRSWEILGGLGNRFSQAHPASFRACYVQEVLKGWPRAGLLRPLHRCFSRRHRCARVHPDTGLRDSRRRERGGGGPGSFCALVPPATWGAQLFLTHLFSSENGCKMDTAPCPPPVVSTWLKGNWMDRQTLFLKLMCALSHCLWDFLGDSGVFRPWSGPCATADNNPAA